MDDEDIQHWYRLITEYTRHLRIVEEKIAAHGRLEAPTSLITDERQTKEAIGQLNQSIRRRKRNAGEAEVLYNAEEVGEIYEKIARIGQLEQVIPMQEGTIETLKGAFFREHQSWKGKFMIPAIAFLLLQPTLRVILEIISYFSGGTKDIPSDLYTGIFFAIVSIVLLIVLFKQLGEIYREVRNLERKLQANKDELQTQKSELNKIYKVAE